MAVSNTSSFGKRAPLKAAMPVRAIVDAEPARALAIAPPHPVAQAVSRLPYFTAVFSVILITRFTAELQSATDWYGRNAPGHFTLLAMGASSRDQVIGHGEWWRLFTQSLLHGSMSHLVGNLVTFIVVGLLLEPMVGIGWFAAIYFTGGFAGAMLSMLLNAPDMLSVGASGAIMAVLAALFTLSFHAGARRPNLMRRVAGGSLFPALIPSVAKGGAMVDINAHLGGCLAGVTLAFLMLIFWHDDSEEPPARGLAAVIACFWVALTVGAFASASTRYVQYARPGLAYIPPHEMPADVESMKADSFSLVEKYPKDPRAHLFRGLYFLETHDVADAEGYFREAVRLGENSPVMGRAFSDWTKALLALDVRVQGREPEAKAIVAPLCAAADLDLRTQQTLKITRLCE